MEKKMKIIGLGFIFIGLILFSLKSIGNLTGFVILDQEAYSNSWNYFFGIVSLVFGIVLVLFAKYDGLVHRVVSSEDIIKSRQGVPAGAFCAGIDMDYRNYKISAYPGSDVVMTGRAEHLPLHMHVVYPGKKGRYELRIDCETLQELDGQKIPKDLLKYIKQNKKTISQRVEQLYQTGKLD